MTNTITAPNAADIERHQQSAGTASGALLGNDNTLAAEINRLHELACLRADEAVNHAVEAGKMLLRVKAALKHGQFVSWMDKYLAVSPRQAQRYMAAAQGRPVPIRAKAKDATPVSQIDRAKKAKALTTAARAGAEIPEELRKWFGQPAFMPAPGHWYGAVTDVGAVWLVPSLAHPEHFHLSRLYDLPEDQQQAPDDDPEGWDGRSAYDGTRRPVPSWMVETYLQTQFGIADPVALDWTTREKPGQDRPFGEPAAKVGA